MRLPRVTLRVESVESGGTTAAGECVGAGLMALLVLQVLSSATPVPAGADGGVAGCAAFLLGSAAVLVALALVDSRVHSLFRSTRPAWAAAGLVGSGCALYAASLVAAGGPVGAAGLLAMGAGMGLFAFLWGISFSRMEVTDIVVASTMGTALGFMGFAATGTALPREWCIVMAGALQLAHVPLLHGRVTDNLPDSEMRQMRYFGELQVRRGSFAVKIVPTMVAMGAAATTLLVGGEGVVGPGSGPAWPLAASVAVVAVAAFQQALSRWLRRAERPFGYPFRFMLPIAAALALPVPVAQQACGAAGVSILCSASVMIALAWGFQGTLSQEFRLSPVFVFGLGTASASAGALAALLLYSTVAPATSSFMTAGSFGLVATLFCLVVAGGFNPRAEDVRAIVVASYHPHEMYGAPSSSNVPGEPGAPSADDLPRSHAGTPYAQQGEQGDGEREEARKGRFVRRCEYVADTFLLSRRETEVLLILAKGRNVSHISQQLGISEGTAKTHVNHVYKKLGVHSQQQLIGLVDSFDE